MSIISNSDHLIVALRKALKQVSTVHIKGRVVNVSGSIVRAVLPAARVGELCLLCNPGDPQQLHAEVVGLDRDGVLLTPIGDLEGIGAQTEVVPTGRTHMVRVGPALLGRVLDGLGNPLDAAEKGALEASETYPVHSVAPDPLLRRKIQEPFETGVRAIDALLTCAEGQRLGVFAAAGVGKSTLLAMLVKSNRADVMVVALIGERGREVREFIENELDEQSRRRCVIVCATSDRSAMERVKAAHVATAIAEYFRDQSLRVLLLMDSVTRFARAQREIGLAAGEPPTRRGFPPSVFAALPRLLERTGFSDKGSITAFYTVLVEGDDMAEPVADETRSILDGHIVLSRKLADAGHYPAIDVLASVSRVMNAIVGDEHREHANRVRELLAKYQDVELLVRIGEYKRGGDPLTDEALDKRERINNFLRQDFKEYVPMSTSSAELQILAES